MASASSTKPEKSSFSASKNVNSTVKMDTMDYSQTDENYRKLHLYIEPRRISIYAPHFKYGPNRRYPEDDEEEDEEDVGNNKSKFGQNSHGINEKMQNGGGKVTGKLEKKNTEPKNQTHAHAACKF